jgi:hypothetical protein
VIQVQKATPLPQTSLQPKPLRMVANIVSYVCHPVFMPVVMAYVVYRLMPDEFVGLTPKQVGLLFINIGYTSVFFPLFSIFLMKQLGFISGYHMPTARERTGPLMATMIFYFWVSHVFNNMPGIVPLGLKVLLLGNLWGIILLFMANIFTKVSMHTAAAGGAVGIIIVLMIMSSANMVAPLLIAIIVAGIIGIARAILGMHQRGDIWLGYIIGIIVQLGAYVYMK